MFRLSQHPSSGVLKTETAASGTGHNTGAATSLRRGLIGSPDQATLEGSSCTDSIPVTEDTVTVFSTPDDGCCDNRNM